MKIGDKVLIKGNLSKDPEFRRIYIGLKGTIQSLPKRPNSIKYIIGGYFVRFDEPLIREGVDSKGNKWRSESNGIHCFAEELKLI